MLAVGQTVVYGTQGVCMVKEISMLKLGKTKGEYYVLSPIDDPGSTVYVPTASEKLANKLRPVLTGSEANALIDEAANEPLDWITSDNERKTVCDDIVKNGSRKQLMQLVGMLYRRREALKDQKKHFHNVDAQYLKTHAARRAGLCSGHCRRRRRRVYPPPHGRVQYLTRKL